MFCITESTINKILLYTLPIIYKYILYNNIIIIKINIL